MALWNDKRTPKGIVTDTHTGQNRPMGGSQHPSIGVGARYAAPRPNADMHRQAAPQPTKPKPAAPVQNNQVAPKSAPVGKVPVDRASNAAAAKEVAGIAKKSPGGGVAKAAASKMAAIAAARKDKSNVKGSKASGKPAPRAR